MALIKCTECGKEISDSAECCPNCGCRTKHGETVSQAKGMQKSYIVVAVLLIVGFVLFFPALFEMRDVDSYYWTSGLWVRYDDLVSLVFKFLIGLGMIIGSFIDMKLIADKAQYLAAEGASQKLARPEEIEVISVAYIPDNKREHGACEMCKAEGIVAVCKIPNQFGDHELCPKCISRYGASIR